MGLGRRRRGVMRHGAAGHGLVWCGVVSLDGLAEWMGWGGGGDVVGSGVVQSGRMARGVLNGYCMVGWGGVW